MTAHYERVDDTTWPVILAGPDDDSPEWNLRYGSPDRDDRLFLASIVAAYTALTDPNRPQYEAVHALRRARQAQRQAQEKPS
jgi:hypothetical protein